MCEPEAYPLGYVEDSHKPRTQLMARFSIRLEEPLSAKEEGARHPGMRDTETNAAFALVDKVLLIQCIHDIKPDDKLLAVPR